MIDFAKTVSLPSGASITHMNEWTVGNHEDGYLIGINNLIQIFEEILANVRKSVPTEKQLNKNEADFAEDYEFDELKSNCVGENSFESTAKQMNNVDLLQEIDAMKIDQAMKQSSREPTDASCTRKEAENI